MKRFKCLLLDANIVIELFSLGLWDAFVKQYEVHLSEIVVGEAAYHADAIVFRVLGNLKISEQGVSSLFKQRVQQILSFMKRTTRLTGLFPRKIRSCFA